ncbi:hypothetical protein [Photobacterium leiognathi]|uniref:hypothetical protein n=1 Tax=Photobacterium leiognathi TaxID=553611 RepID=UPI002980F422|nr:hypothetical protein [Photobacterium leiognathi]
MGIFKFIETEEKKSVFITSLILSSLLYVYTLVSNHPNGILYSFFLVVLINGVCIVKDRFWLVIAASLVIWLVYAYSKSYFFDGYPFDGPFQSYNALRRIDAGSIIGNDYDYFHGAGIPYLNYVFYKLFGGDLFASEFSRYFINILATIPVIWFIFYFSENNKTAKFATIIYLIVSLSCIVMSLNQSPLQSEHLYLVRNIAILITIILLTRSFNKYNELILLSLMNIVAFYLGNEQGVYHAIAVFMAQIFFFKRFTNFKLNIAWAITTLITSVCLLLISNEILFSSQRSILFIKDISQDQIWYFGSYPNEFYHGLKYLFDSYSIINIRLIANTILVLLTVYLVFKMKKGALLKKVSSILLIYGFFSLSSELGYLSVHYFDSLTRASVIIIAIIMSFDKDGLYNTIDKSVANKIYILNIFRIKHFSVTYNLLLFILVFGLLSSSHFFGSLKSLYSEYKIHKEFDQKPNEYLGVLLKDNTHWKHKEQVELLSKKNNNIITDYTDKDFIRGVNTSTIIHLKVDGQLKKGFSGLMLFQNKLYNFDYVNQNTIRIRGRLIRNTGDENIKLYYAKSLSEQCSLRGNSAKEFYNNSSFINSISKKKAVLFLPDSNNLLTCKDKFLNPGDKLKFNYSGERVVEKVYSNGLIKLNGGDLSPYLDGYPFVIDIVKKAHSKIVLTGQVLSTKLVNKIKLLEQYNGEVILTYGGEKYKVISNNGVITLPSSFNLNNSYKLSYESSSTYIKKVQGEKIWSLYTGIFDAYYNQLNPSGIDYMIHVLGDKKREQYLSSFIKEKPEYVTMPISRNVDEIYKPYLKFYTDLSYVTYWRFYSNLFSNYKLVNESKYSLLLQKDNSRLSTKVKSNYEPVKINVKDNHFTFNVKNISQYGNYKMGVIKIYFKLNYKFKLPILSKTERHYFIVNNSYIKMPVPIIPYQNYVEFPFVINKNSDTLDIKMIDEHPFGSYSTVHMDNAYIKSIDNNNALILKAFDIDNL